MECITCVDVHHVNINSWNLAPIKRNLIKNNKWDDIKIGDLIVNDKVAGYRTNGVYIIGYNTKNNKDIMYLSDYPDDYGTIPKEFYTPLYTPDAILGKDEIDWHNSFVPVDITKFEFTQDFIDIEDTYNQDICKFAIAKYGIYTYAFNIDDIEQFKKTTEIIYMHYSGPTMYKHKDIDYFLLYYPM